MEQERIDQMKRTKRLNLGRLQTFQHYLIVFFILFIQGLILWPLFEINVTKTYDGVRSVDELLSGSWPWIPLAIFFYVIQKRRLRFYEIKVNYSEQEFNEAIERTAKELEWQIEINGDQFFRAYRPWNWPRSLGEMITIIKNKDRLLLNSICDPDKWGSITSYGWNKRNVDTFVKNLNDIKQGVPVRQEIKEPEKEWTVSKIIVRLFAYPLSLVLIVLGIYLTFHPVNWKSTFLGIAVLVIAVTYLYSDLKILAEKKSKNLQRTHKAQDGN